MILVGEIRDLETAQIAVQASLTGHMVFSTLHTNDAPSTVTPAARHGAGERISSRRRSRASWRSGWCGGSARTAGSNSTRARKCSWS